MRVGIILGWYASGSSHLTVNQTLQVSGVRIPPNPQWFHAGADKRRSLQSCCIVGSNPTGTSHMMFLDGC